MLRWGRCASCWCCVGCSYGCRRSSAPFSGLRVLKVCLIRVSPRVSPRQSRADSRCAGRGYTAGLPARPLSARGTTVLTLRNTAMDTIRRLGGMVVRVTMGHELNLVQCGGAILALVLHATVTGASRYAALGSVR